MKKILVFTFLLFLISCSSNKNELYKLTDSFVQSLQTDYQSYGLAGGINELKVTSDSLYQVTPIGRLINVKILKEDNVKDYNDLIEDLKNHYKKDKRVNEVYLNNLGTIIIDCRN